MKEIFQSREQEELIKQRQSVDFDSSTYHTKEVWICLLRGGVVILSERAGGAKLEFISAITNELGVRKPGRNEELSANCVIIEGVGQTKGRSIALESRSPGAQYVFEKQLSRLVAEYKSPTPAYVEGATEAS